MFHLVIRSTRLPPRTSVLSAWKPPKDWASDRSEICHPLRVWLGGGRREARNECFSAFGDADKRVQPLAPRPRQTDRVPLMSLVASLRSLQRS
jgi:hypothetical protein